MSRKVGRSQSSRFVLPNWLLGNAFVSLESRSFISIVKYLIEVNSFKFFGSVLHLLIYAIRYARYKNYQKK